MPPLSLTIWKYALTPSTSGAYEPVKLFVLEVIAATSISVLVTPGAVTGTFFLRSDALAVVVGPPAGTVASEVTLLDPALLHAAAMSTIARPAVTTRADMIPPGRPRVAK